jgi:hypothetical protein
MRVESHIEEGDLWYGDESGFAQIVAKDAGTFRLSLGYIGDYGCNMAQCVSQAEFAPWFMQGAGADCLMHTDTYGLLSISLTNMLSAKDVIEGKGSISFEWNSTHYSPIDPQDSIYVLSFRSGQNGNSIPVSVKMNSSYGPAFNFGSLSARNYQNSAFVLTVSGLEKFQTGRCDDSAYCWASSSFSENIQKTTASPNVMIEGLAAGVAMGVWLVLIVLGGIALGLREQVCKCRNEPEVAPEPEPAERVVDPESHTDSETELDEKDILKRLNTPLASSWLCDEEVDDVQQVTVLTET